MAPPFFPDILQNVNGLLNRDFYQNTPTAVNISTTASNGVKFNINGKQLARDAPLQANIEARLSDKVTGISISQGWSNKNKLNNKVELNKLVIPGLKFNVMSNFSPADDTKSAKLNLSLVKPFFSTRATLDKSLFTGNLTLSHDNIVTGAEFSYDIASGTISRHAMAMAYQSKDYTIGLLISDMQLATASFYQVLNSNLQVGAKATMNSKLNSNVNIEFATKYRPDESSQIKCKINDLGKLTVSCKQDLKKGITVGVGASMNALKLDEPIQKIGWSLNFSS
ncbi:hypothetical protein KAFR_0J01550 [Kazachstania africana CBS 2517]|uniref:Mitochondrial outer membrane protein porin n=1 Tax=Kazachstania africana (strain ATCC 22294 / BCRC 22015 / CBS 2517 / CECT 1963 / NBRC 1671 / NRRL Y-8276) TaxID=1071382 RepID=H2B0S1_KAZAF|nr:hypothetical protein KAFR_0J01550 [Kazachstania africana CBS 2517]CCF60221.1 hypothetical protein KAFR_0J01550 [Kazachstania africana CBS 2517]